MCCLCQPELLPEEEVQFRGEDRLSKGLSEKHISPDVRGAAISLRGAHGSCFFLRDKRCTIYQDRPHYCRAFPISLFSGWRIQANANLSCRGLGLPGQILEVATNELLGSFGDDFLESELNASRKVFSEFNENARLAKVDQSVSSVREAAGALIEELSDEVGLSRLLTYAQGGRTRHNSAAEEIAKRARRAETEADVESIAIANGAELFDLPDLSYLPVYIDRDLVWRIFKLEDGAITGYILSEDGETEKFSDTDPGEVSLLPLTEGGKDALRAYMGLVNRRDCFLGHAAHICDMEGYSYNFAQVYLGAMATVATDVWWRASFLARLEGRSQLGPSELREGIVFFDMDLLDQPTIGAFL